MIEALEKLRGCVIGYNDAECRAIADVIETELKERYMELPLDADGVPIRVGDILEADYDNGICVAHKVVALIYDGMRSIDFDGGIWDFQFDDDEDGEDSRVVNCMSDFYKCSRHVKPRTVEDVLEEFAHEWNDTHHDDMPALKARYADELRGMGVGE